MGKGLSDGFLGGSFFEDVLDLHPEPWGNDPILTNAHIFENGCLKQSARFKVGNAFRCLFWKLLHREFG